MKDNYLCPHCKGQLGVKESIIFSTKTTSGETGLIFLSPELGNYKRETHSTFVIPNGDQLNFFCPICHTNLQAVGVNTKLARVLMIDDLGKESQILFSEVSGEECTYKITLDNVESYGDSANQYVNFFGEEF